MAVIVRKYGGSSVATLDKIKNIAAQIKRLHLDGNKVVVVVSAMGKTTDELLSAAREISQNPDPRELDMLLSIGERKSISLMALALNAIDVPAVSYTGSQVGIITNNHHGDARILEIKADRLLEALNKNKVVVIAGYQGVSVEKEITTLGRGGTDTTAVAVAAAINADCCELMKDVDGLYNVSPSFIKDAHLRREVSYDDLQQIADSGAELVAKTAVQIAKKYHVKLSIGHTVSGSIGTIVTDASMAQKGIQQCVVNACVVSRGLPNALNTHQKVIQSNRFVQVIDLSPDQTNKNAVLINLFGSELFLYKELIDYIQSTPFLYLSCSDSRIECVYNHSDYNAIADTLKERIGRYLT